MNRKQLTVIIVIAFFVGALGSIVLGRFLIPYLGTFKGLSWLNGLSSTSPIVVNRTQEVQLNEGVNLIDLIKQAGNIVVSIYDTKNNFLGNGLVVTSDGLIFSSNAVVGKQTQFWVLTNDGQKFSGTLKGRDPSGVAILDVSASSLTIDQFDNAADLEPGQRVIYIGRSNVKFEHQALTSFVTQSLANQLDGKQISSDAVLNSSYFGGPIINLSGHVVGLVIDGSRNIISENLKTLLDQYLAK